MQQRARAPCLNGAEAFASQLTELLKSNILDNIEKA